VTGNQTGRAQTKLVRREGTHKDLSFGK
jgi:hypothetical protein